MSGQSLETEGTPNPTSSARAGLLDRLARILLTGLDLDITDPDADLLSTGLIDSLGIVTLLLALEQEFGLEIAMEDFEIDDFRSISAIGDFVMRRLSADEPPADR